VLRRGSVKCATMAVWSRSFELGRRSMKGEKSLCKLSARMWRPLACWLKSLDLVDCLRIWPSKRQRHG
jgi:hypothetical protein